MDEDAFAFEGFGFRWPGGAGRTGASVCAGQYSAGCCIGPSAGSGGAPHVWLAGQPAVDLIGPLDAAASAIYAAFLVAEEGTAATFRAARPACLANTACR